MRPTDAKIGSDSVSVPDSVSVSDSESDSVSVSVSGSASDSGAQCGVHWIFVRSMPSWCISHSGDSARSRCTEATTSSMM